MVKDHVYMVFGIICNKISKMPVHCTEHKDAFFTKHLLLLTHAGVIPCVKINDILRILLETWYLDHFIEKMISRER